ncbi:hypothetical protein HCG51_09645 [Tolypothrix sp. PCC 7910]|nr:hypothetical protein [Tolypothrix sp. PCC 7910]QIR36973.1 hypothetical protein HCG51_09645 [Tolypothrix sp. PCC 7910]
MARNLEGEMSDRFLTSRKDAKDEEERRLHFGRCCNNLVDDILVLD